MKNVRLLISEFFRLIAFVCQILYAIWCASPMDKARLRFVSSRAPVSIYFDKDPIPYIKNGTPHELFNARHEHLNFRFCYCKKCKKKYLLYVHYTTPIVSIISEGHPFLSELDRKLVFPLRTKKLKKLLNGI